MKSLEISKAKASLADYARRIGRGPFILTDHGKPKAALVSIANADWETVKLSTDPRFLALIERSRARHKAHGGFSSEEMRHRLGMSKDQ